jgi:hypothetical protein
MRVLLWHVHGSWTTSFVQGSHEYVVPVNQERDDDGRGRARTWDWPDSVSEVPLEQLRTVQPDVVVLQRPRDLCLVRDHLGLDPGSRLPAVYVEHNTPRGDLADARHPLAHRSDIPVVHVTPFNQAMWDNGSAPTTVIEHGLVDPGHLWTGALPRAAVAINEPVRRGRITGTDLVPKLARIAPVDLFGMGASAAVASFGAGTDVSAHDDLPQSELHRAMAARRVYLHTARWTSLGLALVEAMHLGMPVVAFGATDVWEAVPPGAGVVSTRLGVLQAALREFVADPAAAREVGGAARRHALAQFGLARFLDDWDRLLKEVT